MASFDGLSLEERSIIRAPSAFHAHDRQFSIPMALSQDAQTDTLARQGKDESWYLSHMLTSVLPGGH